MSRADQSYYVRRANEEQARADQSATVEARASHQQLHDLYLMRAGHRVEGAGLTVFASARG